MFLYFIFIDGWIKNNGGKSIIPLLSGKWAYNVLHIKHYSAP